LCFVFVVGGAYRDRARERSAEAEVSFAKIQQETLVCFFSFFLFLKQTNKHKYTQTQTHIQT